MKFNEILKVIFLTLFLAGILAVDDYLVPTYTDYLPILHAYKWYLLVFFATQSLFTTFLTSFGLKNDTEYFQNYYFSAMIIRMLLCIAAIFYVVYQGVEKQLLFILTFFGLYFCYISFEIKSLLSNLRQNSK